MSFFSFKEKRLALKTSTSNLQQAYSLSEARLRDAAKTGDSRQLKEAMAEHGLYEMLFYTRALRNINARLTKGGFENEENK